MRIPTNETILRENLHEAVDSLSLVNIIILFMLIRVVQVISFLRPGEHDLASLPAPTLEIPSDFHGGQHHISQDLAHLAPDWLNEMRNATHQWTDSGRYLPNRINGVTFGSGPEPDSGEITLTLFDGREVSFEDWHFENERQRQMFATDFSTINIEVTEYTFPYSGRTGIREVPILGWAENDRGERIIMFRSPVDGTLWLRNHNDSGPTYDNQRQPINAIHYSMESLEYQCERGNRMLREMRGEASYYSGYCTPDRHGLHTSGRVNTYGGGSDTPHICWGHPAGSS